MKNKKNISIARKARVSAIVEIFADFHQNKSIFIEKEPLIKKITFTRNVYISFLFSDKRLRNLSIFNEITYLLKTNLAFKKYHL